MCDPIGRLDIINDCSYLFPLDVAAAYIGPLPNHQNGRILGWMVDGKAIEPHVALW